MKIWTVAAAAIVIVSAAVVWRVLPGADTDMVGFLPYGDPDAVARGRAVYADYCAACHGAALEGQPDWRQRDEQGYLPAPPHDASGHTWHHPDAQLVDITWLGTERIVGGSYKSRMMGFEGTLTKEEVIAVLAFIKSTWPPDIVERHNQINAAAAVPAE